MAMIPLEVPIDLSREEAQRRAAEELSKLRYGVDLPPWLRQLLDRLRSWLNSLLDPDLPPDATGGGGGSPAVLVIAVLLILAVALLVWRFGLPRINRRRKDGQVGADREISAKQYRSMAEAAAEAGDWRTAVRERFRSLVRELEVRTILIPRPSRTALETAHLASRSLPGVRSPLFESAETFGTVEYGDTPATEAHYRRLTEVEKDILAAADKVDLDVLEEVAR